VALSAECRSILLEILKIEILKIRSIAHSGNAVLISAISDHIHNLPDLIKNDSEATLRYYMDVEVPCYASRVGPTPSLSSLWDSLRSIVPARQEDPNK